jgi:iron complex transport system substrate-binding protein
MTHRRIAAALLAALTLVAACGDDSDDAATTGSDATASGSGTDASATTASSGTSEASDTAVADTPAGDVKEAIVSLSATGTEMLFAIGAGDQVIAVDSTSNYPPEVLELPHELSALEPNVEAIAALEPDLVVIGGDFTGLTEQLAALDIEVWDGPAATTFGDVYAQIEELGALTGHEDEAAEVVTDIEDGLDAAAAAAPEGADGLTYYHELDTSLFSITSTSFIGQIYNLFGLRSIADGVEAGNDYPQLSAEAIVGADPDLIFLADSICCGQDATTVAERDGWGAIAAVANGNVFAMNDDLASRWGPRIVDYAEAVADALSQANVPTG